MTAGLTDAAAVVSGRDPALARRPFALLWWGIGLFAAFVLMGVAVAVNAEAPITQPIDAWWRSTVGAAPDGGAHTWFVPMFFQYLGEAPGALAMIVLIPAGLALVGRWRSALFFLSATLLTVGLFSQAMKNLVDRPRPALDEALGLFGPLFQVDHGSFPSGHAVTAGVLVIAVAALIPRGTARTWWWVAGAVIMLGMMWQRTLINAHWLSDTVFGLAAGVAGGLLMWWAFWPWLQQDRGRPVWFLHFRRARETDAAASVSS
ncbi:phosphatase PAP2 family protein [Microbacterium immunditiarum]|uniref:Undecaprenyl-diphosphatase n=1 Tax=Microbacterium immunditiarum TaxID=337480 RepID=A0A7Y9GLX5_9MICO|nr:phosphatase PAP2 family protein [Microbacterium immunditiarum]NYE18918.1 undecaprenyl-diphosphatase [Microbacterium immunditiarum]